MKTIYLRTLASVFLIAIVFNSCKKDTDDKPRERYRKDWVTGKWKQTDLVISVEVKLGGTKIPAGSSMIALAPLLGQALGNPVIAQLILCTKDNEYEFSNNGQFTITGCTDLILPKAGNKGSWDLEIYDAVLELTSESGTQDPHWINNITSNTMELALMVTIPGVGDAPLGLKMEKLP